MGVDSKHPLFEQFQDYWLELRDAAQGERVVKEKGFKYLPPTAGMVADGAMTSTASDGFIAYDAYRKRAHYPDVIDEAVEAMLGIMHSKPPTIELPAVMEPMRESATFRNESLDMLLRRINEEQLTTGRLGLLGDVIDVGKRKGQPYISLYIAEHIVNWDEGQRTRDVDADGETDGTGDGDDGHIEVVETQSLNFVSLNESGFERLVDFEWEEVQKYKILVLGDPLENEAQGADGATYRVGDFRDNALTFSEDRLEEPEINANKASEIPFTFINTKDVASEPDEPPLMGLSSLAMVIYRGEADYRQALFMQGQDTLVVIGSDDPNKKWRVGAGASINITNPAGDAKFIGVDSQGLTEMRSALENDYRRAAQKAGQMLEATSREAESGEALRIRVSARTATLNQIALTGAFGLEQVLRKIARWMGADPEQVTVTPNLDFVDDELAGRTLVEYLTAKSIGAPWSLESIHELMQERGLTKKTWEEEMKSIEAESDLEFAQGGTEEEDGPADDDDGEDEEDPTETAGD